MTTSERREEIALTLHEQIVAEAVARRIDIEVHGTPGLAFEEHLADALLARWPILAGVTDEMVEAGARALFEHDCPTASREPSAAWVRARYEMDARVVLSAALGEDDA